MAAAAVAAMAAAGRDVKLIASRPFLFQFLQSRPIFFFFLSSLTNATFAKTIFRVAWSFPAGEVGTWGRGVTSGFSLPGRSMLTQQDEPRSMERAPN